MDILCGHSLWAFFVGILCGHSLWTFFVDIFCGYSLWIFLLTFFVDIPFDILCGYSFSFPTTAKFGRTRPLPLEHQPVQTACLGVALGQTIPRRENDGEHARVGGQKPPPRRRRRRRRRWQSHRRLARHVSRCGGHSMPVSVSFHLESG